MRDQCTIIIRDITATTRSAATIARVADTFPKALVYQLLRPALRLLEPVQVVCHRGKLDYLLAQRQPLRFDGSGGLGAWELAARWSYIDTNGTAGTGPGGQLNDLTFGLNWYMNNFTKFQFNYIHPFLNQPKTGPSTQTSMRSAFNSTSALKIAAWPPETGGSIAALSHDGASSPVRARSAT
jgi:hypothetical protein